MRRARAGQSLRAYFEDAFRPAFLAQARPATLAIYATLLAFWDAAPARRGLRLTEIDAATLARFRGELAARFAHGSDRQLSTHTVNKYLRHLNALLTKAGPPAERHRDALGLLDAVPWVRTLKTTTTRPRAIPLDVLGRIYRACSAATAPPESAVGIDPAEWWRGLVVVASQTGLRRQALLGLRWVMIDLARDRLVLPAALDKAGVERIKPLNRVTVQHLARLARQSREYYFFAPLPAEAKVFPWPHATLRAFYRNWHAIQDRAGILGPDHYKFHDLKKTAGTQLGTVANAFAVQALLDHASVQTSQRYCDGDAALRAAVEAMPCPAEFLEEVSDGL